MQPDSQKLLFDARAAAMDIQKFAAGKALDQLGQDDLLRSAIYWKFTIIGEAIAQLRETDSVAFDRISESPRIIGFRNRIIHGYAVVEDSITWAIVQQKLPKLIADLQALLAEAEI